MSPKDAPRQIFVAMKQLIDAWEHPHFIFFQDVHLGMSEILEFPMLPHISTMAVFVAFGRGSNMDEIIVIVANGNKGSFKDLVGPGIMEMSSTKEVVEIWKRLNKNIRGNKIYVKMTHRRHKVEYCSISSGTKLYRFSENDCVKSSFLLNSNATLSREGEFSADVFNLIGSETLPFSKASLITDHLQRSLDLHWITHGVRIDNYAFSIFIEGKERMAKANLAAVILPFNWRTWLCVLASVVAMGLVFYVGSVGSSVRSCLWIMGNLLDQSDLSLLRKRGIMIFRGISCYPALASWTVGALLLGFLYKGSLYSYMTSTHEPYVPKTLEALLDGDIPMVTTTYVSSFLSRGAASPLQTLLDDFAMIHDKNSMLHNIIEKINNRTTYIPTSFGTVRVAKNITLFQPIHTCRNGYMSECEDTTTKILGKKFAIFSIKQDIAAFSNYLNQFSRWTEIPNGSPNPVTLHVPWIMFYNFVYARFSRHLAGLVVWNSLVVEA